jgi:hypothetical protein
LWWRGRGRYIIQRILKYIVGYIAAADCVTQAVSCDGCLVRSKCRVLTGAWHVHYTSRFTSAGVTGD